MFLLALAAAAAQPQPGRLHTFGDWTVGCDNVRTCQAVALVPEGENRDRYLLLVVGRDARRPPTLSVAMARYDLPSGSLTLRVDGREVARVRRLVGQPFDGAVASALARGGTVSVTGDDGPPLASASLAGLSAAFLYMDEQQRRLGTVGALIRRGPRPEGAAPPAPPLPRIVQPRPTNRPPRAPTPIVAARLAQPGCDEMHDRTAPHAIRLDARHSLVLIRRPSDDGAYNLMSEAYIVDEAGRTRSAHFDVPTGMHPEDRRGNILVNADWNAGTRRLSSFAKGRGLGDCGVVQEFAWDGARFRLVRRSEMGECRGSTDYITTWRAAVTNAR